MHLEIDHSKLLNPPPVRTSVSFPADIYATLEQIAKQKKVSIAWIVREAAEKYVDNHWPLLSNQNRAE